MILGVTIIAVAVATLAFLAYTDKDGKMTSYLWGLLGYAADPKPSSELTFEDQRRLSSDATKGAREEVGVSVNITTPERPRTSSSEDGGERTPKAMAGVTEALPPVPSFTLQEHRDEDEDESDEDNLPPPSFPAMNSAQRASAMPPPAISTPRANGLMAPPAKPNGFMAPPPRPVPSLRPTPPAGNTAAGLRVPTTGPLPNRNPTLSSNSLSTPITTATKTPNPRQKVLLKPGHSPLDWANLKRSGQNLAGVDRLIRVTPSMLKSQNGRKGKPAWSSYQGKVYNLSPYIPFHPGGEGELRRVAGKDGAKLFHEVHPWVNWENMLEGCMVGIMVSEGDAEVASELDDMD